MQVINRDLSIAVLRYFIGRRAEEIASGQLKPHRSWSRQQGGPAYVPEGAAAAANGSKQAGEGIRVLEGLSATGLRSIRYAYEVALLSVAQAYVGAVSSVVQTLGGGPLVACPNKCNECKGYWIHSCILFIQRILSS